MPKLHLRNHQWFHDPRRLNITTPFFISLCKRRLFCSSLLCDKPAVFFLYFHFIDRLSAVLQKLKRICMLWLSSILLTFDQAWIIVYSSPLKVCKVSVFKCFTVALSEHLYWRAPLPQIISMPGVSRALARSTVFPDYSWARLRSSKLCFVGCEREVKYSIHLSFQRVFGFQFLNSFPSYQRVSTLRWSQWITFLSQVWILSSFIFLIESRVRRKILGVSFGVLTQEENV